MTRPMPEPPERTSHDRHSAAGFIRSDCPWCASFRADESKRLTDAECAAEYWRALRDDEWEDYDMLDGYGPPNIDPWGKEWWARSGIANEDRLSTWRRFATRPHALEEA